MFSLWFVFFCSFFLFIKFFSKKILVLLSLEILFISLIGLFFFFSFLGGSVTPFFSSMCFLTFMVLDSVFGLSLLIFSSRNSSIYSSIIFFV